VFQLHEFRGNFLSGINLNFLKRGKIEKEFKIPPTEEEFFIIWLHLYRTTINALQNYVVRIFTLFACETLTTKICNVDKNTKFVVGFTNF
jgi:hypothetical protein